MKHHQFNRVLLHANFELDRFDNTLSQLEANDYPSDVAQHLIQAERIVSGNARVALNAIEVDYADDPAGASARLQSECRKLCHRREVLEVLSKAKCEEVPWSVVPCIQRMANVLHADRRVLVTTTPDMNYMISWSLINPKQPVTIYLPKLHRANAFLHVLIGHELFHPALQNYFVVQKPVVLPKLREDCRALLAKEEGAPDLFSTQRLDAMLNYATVAWEQGITELMCDMGAAAIFGPAALWTISGFAAIHDMDVEPSPENGFYPPWRLRMRVVRDYLKGIDSSEVHLASLCDAIGKQGLEGHAAALRESTQFENSVCDEGGAVGAGYKPIMAKVYERVVESIPSAQLHVKDVSAKLDDRWTQTSKGLPTLLKRIGMLVPPSEIIRTGDQKSEAAPTSAIVLAFWIERLRAERDKSMNLQSFRRLCRLMLKALDDAELKRDFVSHGGE